METLMHLEIVEKDKVTLWKSGDV